METKEALQAMEDCRFYSRKVDELSNSDDPEDLEMAQVTFITYFDKMVSLYKYVIELNRDFLNAPYGEVLIHFEEAQPVFKFVESRREELYACGLFERLQGEL